MKTDLAPRLRVSWPSTRWQRKHSLTGSVTGTRRCAGSHPLRPPCFGQSTSTSASPSTRSTTGSPLVMHTSQSHMPTLGRRTHRPETSGTNRSERRAPGTRSPTSKRSPHSLRPAKLLLGTSGTPHCEGEAPWRRRSCVHHVGEKRQVSVGRCGSREDKDRPVVAAPAH